MHIDSVFVAKNGVSPIFGPRLDPEILEYLGSDELDGEPTSGASSPDYHPPVASVIKRRRSYNTLAEAIEGPVQVILSEPVPESDLEPEPEPEPVLPDATGVPEVEDIIWGWGTPGTSKKDKKKKPRKDF